MPTVTVQQAIQAAMQHHQAGRWEEAEEIYRQILGHQPEHPDALHLLGVVAGQTGRNELAESLIRRAIGIVGDDAAFHANLGLVLSQQGRNPEAVESYRRALALKPDYPEAHYNSGVVLGESGRLDEAIAAYREAIRIRPGYLDAHNNLGNALWKLRRLDEAIAAFCRAIEIQPDDARMRSNWLLTLHFVRGSDSGEIFAQHRRWDEIHARPLADAIGAHGNDRDAERRLRVGYVSPDFREHSVAFFLEGLLANHDLAEVEVFCYADLRRPDAFTVRMRTHAAHWRGIFGIPDEEVAGMIRADGIDLLVDLAGHTADNRLLIFARKPAPVQVSWLGYCDTTGMQAMDNRLTDAHADPPGTTEHLYSEKLVRLLAVFACFRPAEVSPPVAPLPALSRGQVTFGSCHTLAKLNDPLLDLWAAILKGVPGSRLLMVAMGLDEPACRARYMNFFHARGVEPQRIEFRGRQTLPGYLALHNEVDVLLDSHPFSGHTVSCHALWMGVPVVTLAGRTHCSRMVASVLMNLGRPERIARTPEEHVDIATALVSNVPRLAGIRGRLREQTAASLLTDATRFTRNVEIADRDLWRAWCASRDKEALT